MPKVRRRKVGPGLGDTLPAALTAFGIMAAVFRANKTGEGQFVDVAMYDAMLAFCERIIYQYSYTGEVPGPEGNAHPLLCPFGLFPVRDGLVAIACPMDQFWATTRARDGTGRSRRTPALPDQRGACGAQRRSRRVDLGVDHDTNEGAAEGESWRRPSSLGPYTMSPTSSLIRTYAPAACSSTSNIRAWRDQSRSPARRSR